MPVTRMRNTSVIFIDLQETLHKNSSDSKSLLPKKFDKIEPILIIFKMHIQAMFIKQTLTFMYLANCY